MSSNNVISKKSVNFKCPSCDGQILEEIMVDVVYKTSIVNLMQYQGKTSDDKHMVAVTYGNSDADGGEVESYGCAECGFMLEDEFGGIVNGPEELFDWLQEKNMLS